MRSTTGKNGRPTSLTPTVQQAILEHLRAGAYFSAACEAVGVPASTGHGWLKRARSEDGQLAATEPYVSFRQAVERAQAEYENGLVRVIEKAAPTEWKAAAWLLERRFKDRWGKEATVPQNEPIRVVWTKHWRTRGVPPEPEPLPTGSE